MGQVQKKKTLAKRSVLAEAHPQDFPFLQAKPTTVEAGAVAWSASPLELEWVQGAQSTMLLAQTPVSGVGSGSHGIDWTSYRSRPIIPSTYLILSTGADRVLLLVTLEAG